MDVWTLAELRSELSLAWSLLFLFGLKIFLINGRNGVLKTSIPSLKHLIRCLIKFKTVNDLNGGLLWRSISFSALQFRSHSLNWCLAILSELDIIFPYRIGSECIVLGNWLFDFTKDKLWRFKAIYSSSVGRIIRFCGIICGWWISHWLIPLIFLDIMGCLVFTNLACWDTHWLFLSLFCLVDILLNGALTLVRIGCIHDDCSGAWETWCSFSLLEWTLHFLGTFLRINLEDVGKLGRAEFVHHGWLWRTANRDLLSLGPTRGSIEDHVLILVCRFEVWQSTGLRADWRLLEWHIFSCICLFSWWILFKHEKVCRYLLIISFNLENQFIVVTR